MTGGTADIERFQEKLAQFEDFRKDFCTLDENLLHAMDETIKTSLPRLLAQLPANVVDPDVEEGPARNPFDEEYVAAA